MSRTLNSPIADVRGEFTYLYEITHSGGIIRITNASSDIIALSQTWTAVGGALIHSMAPDVADRKAQGAELELFGVSQTIISAIQNNQFRGRPIKIYLVHINPDTGVVGTPDLIFQGFQNGDYRVTESRDRESPSSGGTVTVRTRISSHLSAINSKQSCRCNVHSHEELIRRSGVASPDDKFFERVPTIMNKDIFWGTATPELGTRSGGFGGGFNEEDDIGG